MNLVVPTTDQLSAMYDLSVTIHAKEYIDWVPADRRLDFIAHYTSTPENRDQFVRVMKSRLASKRWTIRAAETDGKIMGYIAARDENPTQVMIRSLFVDTSARLGGIGRALMNAVLQDRVQYSLNVATSNVQAQQFYQKFGFKETDEPTGTFFGIPLLHMQRTLTKHE